MKRGGVVGGRSEKKLTWKNWIEKSVGLLRKDVDEDGGCFFFYSSEQNIRGSGEEF